MTANGSENVNEQEKAKREIRARAKKNRQLQGDKDSLSRRIWDRLAGLPEFTAARRLLVYVGMPEEVQTRPFLPRLWAEGRRIAVPCCTGNRLDLFGIETLAELAPGTLGILEPLPVLRRADRKVEVGDLDLIVVPGVAFDKAGGRLGHGKRYYDNLLRCARPETPLVGLAFECQIFPSIPMLDHDVFMDKVVTETAVYERSNDEIRIQESTKSEARNPKSEIRKGTADEHR